MNVVFDLGGVVFTWQPDQIIKSVFEDRETQEKVRLEMFAHPDWVELDRGILDRGEAIERGTNAYWTIQVGNQRTDAADATVVDTNYGYS